MENSSRETKIGVQEVGSQQDGLEPNSHQGIVNVLAILSDGKTTMRGPSGTGFMVNDSASSECSVATSLHAIIPDSRAPLSSIEVMAKDGVKYPAHFSRLDRAQDLAVLTLDGVEKTDPMCKHLPLSESKVNEGDTVTRLTRDRWGVPSSHNGTFSFGANRNDIELARLEGEDMNRSMFVFDMYNNRGVDLGGSPILNPAGEVIAIHEGGLDGKTTVATPIHALSSLLRVEPEAARYDPDLVPGEKPKDPTRR